MADRIVIGKDKECAAIWPNAIVKKHAGHNGAHGMFPNTEPDIPAIVSIFLELMGTRQNVLLEGARSAEPPIRVGSFPAMAFSTFPEAFRVAMGAP